MENVRMVGAMPSTYSGTPSLATLAVVAVALAPGVFSSLMAPGSGGMDTVDTLSSRHYLFEGSAAPVTLTYVKARSSEERIVYLRQVLGLSITDLAELLGVTRPTVYAWMKGGEMKEEHAHRLGELSSVAEELESAGVAGLAKLAKRKLSTGVSLFDLVKAGKPFSHLLHEVAALAETEQRQRLHKKGGQYSRSTAEVTQTLGVAGYVQDV